MGERSCPHCGGELGPDDTFCESCGTQIASAASTSVAPVDHTVFLKPHKDPPPVIATSVVCSACGGSVSDDGWCMTCGARLAVNPRHSALGVAGWMGCVSDIGLVHWRNEDAGTVAGGPPDDRSGVLIVCDGVSSSTDGDAAAAAAVGASRDVLTGALDHRPASLESKRSWWSERLVDAGAAASKAVVAAADAIEETANPPSCTFVVAVADGDLVATGCLGDSRVYWLPDGGEPHQVTVDDSWATEQIAAGTAREVAEADNRAHAITRWLGSDAPWTPTLVMFERQGAGGWLVVCSDGLWNYASSPDELAAVMRAGQVRVGDDPVALAESLVAWANERGGHDNVTVALARLTGRTGDEQAETALDQPIHREEE